MSINIEIKDSCLFVKRTTGSNEQLGNEDIKDLFREIQEIDVAVFKEQKWFVLFLPDLQTTGNNFFSIVCRISAYVEQHNMKFSVIAPQKICSLIDNDKECRRIYSAASREHFYKMHIIDGKQAVAMFVDSLLESGAMTLKALLDIKQVTSRVEDISENTSAHVIEIGAVAAIVSNHFLGNLVIGFSADIFKKAMSRFLLMEVEQITPEVRDGAAELLNVIIGQSKMKLNERGFDISQVIPSVMVGEKIEISSVRKQYSVRVVFMTEIGEVSLLLVTNTSTGK